MWLRDRASNLFPDGGQSIDGVPRFGDVLVRKADEQYGERRGNQSVSVRIPPVD
jgi:hypothetical protein